MTWPALVVAAHLAAVPNLADRAWEAYLAGDFTSALQLVEVGLADTTLPQDARVRLLLTRGCVEAIKGRTEPAAQAFQQALALDPLPHITAGDLPPPAWEVFAPLQEKALHSRPPAPAAAPAEPAPAPLKPELPPVTVVKIREHSRKSTLQSLMLPGWGHLSEGRSRGWLFLGAGTALTAGWAASAVACHDARGKYLAARDPTEIADRYRTYDQLFRLSWTLGVSAAASYLLAQFDFFTGPPPETPSSIP